MGSQSKESKWKYFLVYTHIIVLKKRFKCGVTEALTNKLCVCLCVACVIIWPCILHTWDSHTWDSSGILQFINTSCGCQSLLFSSQAWWYWHVRSLMSTSPVFLVIAEFLVTPLSPLVYVQFFLLSVVSVWLYPALQHRLCQDWLACLLSAHASFPSLPDSLLLPAFHTFISWSV